MSTLIPIPWAVVPFSGCSLKLKHLCSRRVQSVSFCFVPCAVGILLEKPFLVEPRLSKIHSCFLQRFFVFLQKENTRFLYFCIVTSDNEVTMHLEVISVQGVRCECSPLLARGYLVVRHRLLDSSFPIVLVPLLKSVDCETEGLF